MDVTRCKFPHSKLLERKYNYNRGELRRFEGQIELCLIPHCYWGYSTVQVLLSYISQGKYGGIYMILNKRSNMYAKYNGLIVY